MINFEPNLWGVVALLVSTILPLITGLVTTRATSAGVKAVILAFLSAITGLLTELLASHRAGAPYDLWDGLLAALTAFLIAVGLHYGLWKPTGAAGAAQDVGASR